MTLRPRIDGGNLNHRRSPSREGRQPFHWVDAPQVTLGHVEPSVAELPLQRVQRNALAAGFDLLMKGRRLLASRLEVDQVREGETFPPSFYEWRQRQDKWTRLAVEIAWLDRRDQTAGRREHRACLMRALAKLAASRWAQE